MSDTITSLRWRFDDAGDLQSAIRSIKTLVAANLRRFFNALRSNVPNPS